MKKPQSTAKLLNLEEGQQAQIAEMLLDGMPYHKVREIIAKSPPEGFGVSVALSAFTQFWQEICVPLHLVRRQRAVSTAKEIAADARTRPGEFDTATIDALQTKALELALSPRANPKDVKALYMLVIKAKEQGLKAESLKLDREKFEFDAAEACLKKLPELKAIAGDSKLDQDAKLKQIRLKLFGVLPGEGDV